MTHGLLATVPFRDLICSGAVTMRLWVAHAPLSMHVMYVRAECAHHVTMSMMLLRFKHTVMHNTARSQLPTVRD